MNRDDAYQIILRTTEVLVGAALAVFSLATLIALVSFDSADPSFNTISSTAEIKNWAGVFGSCTADLLFQLIGLSAFFLCGIALFIAIKMLAKSESSKHLFIKIIITPLCLLTISAFLSALPDPNWWMFNSLGGINGKFILAQLPHLAITPILLFVLALILLSAIFEISPKDWLYFLRYTAVVLRIVFGALLAQLRKLFDKSLNKLNKKRAAKQVIARPKPSKPKLELSPKLLPALAKKGPFSKYKLPEPDLLTVRSSDNKEKKINQSQIEPQSKLLIKVLEDFGVKGGHLGAHLGPVVTLHEFEPEAGTKASRVIGLADDVARAMSAVSARIATIPGKTAIGIELPNQKREMIYLRELLESSQYNSSAAALPIILGKDIAGEAVIADLAKMPHLLIAGTTGSGKSVGLNVMILSLLFKLRPDECKFIMIDPKMLELSLYDGIPHLLAPVVVDSAKAVTALKWVVAEMEERYRRMSSLNVRNISGYNEKVEQAIITNEKLVRKVQTGYAQTGEPIMEEIEFEAKKLPFIVVIVDEMADLMLVAGKEIENSVQRLAQMARAAGIHIIMATQRPSVDVITGVIKANFPTRISFQVTSRIDSRTILGTQGAEQLLGQGDMIYMSGGTKMIRVHGPFCSDGEIENIVNFIKNQDTSEFTEQKVSFDVIEKSDSPGEADDGGSEDLYTKAVAIVRRDQKASISYVQRQLRIGYNRAATLIEKMEEQGVVTPPNISGKREVVD